MSVPAADKLRLLLRRDAETAADLLDAIDALHYPAPWALVQGGRYCHLCPEVWPCQTHLLLHPKERES